MKSIAHLFTVLIYLIGSLALHAQEEAVRDSRLTGVLQRALKGEKLIVVFLGGSVMQGDNTTTLDSSWRHETMTWLKKEFPKAEWNFINAAIPGTGVEFAAFRLQNEVLKKQVPDLLFVEFGAKEQGMTSQLVFGGALEGIVRRVLQQDPRTAIVCVFSLSRYIRDELARGNSDPATAIAKEVVSHYGLEGIDVQSYVLNKLGRSEWEWSKYWIDDVQPNARGHELYAKAVSEHLENSASNSTVSTEPPSQLPGLLFTDQFVNTSIWLPSEFGRGWSKEANSADLSGRFSPEMLTAFGDGEEFTVEFQGRMFGICFLASQEMGSIEVSIDGQPPERISAHHNQPENHIAYRILDYKLAPGTHTASIRLYPDDVQPVAFTLFGFMTEVHP